MMTAETSVVELDRVLAQDVEGIQVQALQQKLVETAEQCRFRLDRGVSPEEAKRLNAMMAACSAGLGLLPALWQTQQERK
jgi:Cu/Ag efflux pump CusA